MWFLKVDTNILLFVVQKKQNIQYFPQNNVSASSDTDVTYYISIKH